MDSMYYAEGLARMVRCMTISEKGKSASPAFYEMKAVMMALFPSVFSTLEYFDFSGSMMLKWKGRDSLNPVMLMAHQDVVGAGDGWSHDPFGGEIADGRVWGRGSLDTKCSLFAIFQAAEELIKENFVPAHDVYITSSCDEEVGGTGAHTIADYLKERGVRFSLILDEGGCLKRNLIPDCDMLFAAIGCGEKGSATLRLTARSIGGHAANASSDNPVLRLARFISYLDTGSVLGSFRSPTAEEMQRRISEFTGKAPENADDGVSVSYTIIQGSDSPSKVPEEAHVIINARFPDAYTPETLCEKISSLASPYSIEVKLENGRKASPVSSYESDSFRFLEKVVAKVYPEAIPVPFILGGGTDSRNYSEVSDDIYRFLPMIVEPDQQRRVHGIDENITIERLGELVSFFKTLISDLE